jgi:hypothetical protein
MTRLGRLTVVLGGYAVALGVAIAVVVLRTLTVPQASSGMYAFGETILFAGVFGLLAVVPTSLALYFLRGYQPLWVAASRSSIALGVLAIAAGGVVLWVSRSGNPAPAVALAHFAALILLFMAPLLAVTFALAALIAPAARFRAQLALAAAMETAVALPFLYWLLSHRA